MTLAPSSRRRGAPARTSLESVLDAALEIVDRDGLDALSLRGVAAALGVTPMSLYRHVDGVDGLLDLVVARLIARSGQGSTVPSTWREAVVAYAEQLRRLIAEHPAYLNAVLRRPVTNRPALVWLDGLIATLRAAGLSPQAAANAYTAIYAFCVGFAALEQGRSAAVEDARPGATTSAPSLGATLNTSGLPHLREAASFLAPGFDDARFRSGLDVICVGIAAECEEGSARQ